jgi:hypothetical protein
MPFTVNSRLDSVPAGLDFVEDITLLQTYSQNPSIHGKFDAYDGKQERSIPGQLFDSMMHGAPNLVVGEPVLPRPPGSFA